MLEVAVRMDSNYLKFCRFKIELAFVDTQVFLSTKNRGYIQKIKQEKLKVFSIHAPHFKVADPQLESILYKLKELGNELLVDNIVIHPSFAKLHTDSTLHSLDLIKSILGDFNICIETFGSKKRWGCWGNFDWLNRYYGFRVCYDFSHTREDEEDIHYYLPIISVFHFSNTVGNKQHLPCFIENGRIDFKKVIKILHKFNWNGVITLEYLKEYHNLLEQDAQSLEELIYG